MTKGPWTLRVRVARPPDEVWPLVERFATRTGSEKVAWAPARPPVRFPVGWSVRRRPLGGSLVECYLHAAPDILIGEEEKGYVYSEMLCVRAMAEPARARCTEATTTVLIEGVSAQQVWNVIRPAEAALLNDRTVEAYAEHGTGPGVGEIQVAVTLVEGHRVATRSKIVAESAPYFAETVSLAGLPGNASRFTLEEVGGGTQVTVTTRQIVDLTLAADQAGMSRFHHAWLGSVKRVLQSA